MENKESLVVINIQRSFSLTDINDIISTACEGGINHWVRFACTSKLVSPTPAYASESIALGGELKFYIINGSELADTPGVQKDSGGWYTTLDLEKLKNGLQLYQNLRGIPTEIGDIDDEISSAIIECACFGEIVFA